MAGVDYVLAVKENQPGFHRAIRAAFERAGEVGFTGCDMVEVIEEGTSGTRSGK